MVDLEPVQFFAFLVAEDVVAGNPMGAVARPETPKRTPKPLQGDDAPERLLEATAAGTRAARYPWPERDVAFLATSLLAGLHLSELLALNVGSIDGRPGERRIEVALQSFVDGGTFFGFSDPDGDASAVQTRDPRRGPRCV